jgi:cell division septal protein FtsQ
VRLDRFFSVVAPALKPRFEHVAYIDMRYTNGFAVGWLDAPEPEQRVTEEFEASG